MARPQGSGDMACVFWTQDKLTSIIPIENVPGELRFVGAIGQMRFTDGKNYPATVIAIGGDKTALEQREIAFVQAAEKAEKADKAKAKRSHKKRVDMAAASAKQIALALGEKAPLDSKSQAMKKMITEKSKVLKKNALDTEKEMDLENIVSRARRSLFAGNSDDEDDNVNDLSEIEDGDVTGRIPAISSSADTPRPNHISSTKFCEIKVPTGTADQRTASSSSNIVSEESAALKSPSSIEGRKRSFASTDECCHNLKKHRSNTAVREMIWDLAQYFGMDVRGDIPRKVSSTDVEILQPLLIPEDQKKIEVTLGNGLWISKTAKSSLLVTSDNDPYKLTRQLVQTIYGKESLQNPAVSAVGLPGQIGIGHHNLEAMYKFVKRNTPWDNPPNSKKGKVRPKLTFANFNREINRKMVSLRRVNQAALDLDSDDEEASPAPKSGKKSSRHQPLRSGTKSGDAGLSPPNTPAKSPAKKWVVTPMKEPNSTGKPANSGQQQGNGFQEQQQQQQQQQQTPNEARNSGPPQQHPYGSGWFGGQPQHNYHFPGYEMQYWQHQQSQSQPPPQFFSAHPHQSPSDKSYLPL